MFAQTTKQWFSRNRIKIKEGRLSEFRNPQARIIARSYPYYVRVWIGKTSFLEIAGSKIAALKQAKGTYLKYGLEKSWFNPNPKDIVG